MLSNSFRFSGVIVITIASRCTVRAVRAVTLYLPTPIAPRAHLIPDQSRSTLLHHHDYSGCNSLFLSQILLGHSGCGGYFERRDCFMAGHVLAGLSSFELPQMSWP